jgi:hypothetical protein
MMGRAGRPQYDRHGVAVIMVRLFFLGGGVRGGEGGGCVCVACPLKQSTQNTVPLLPFPLSP